MSKRWVVFLLGAIFFPAGGGYYLIATTVADIISNDCHLFFTGSSRYSTWWRRCWWGRRYQFCWLVIGRTNLYSSFVRYGIEHRSSISTVQQGGFDTIFRSLLHVSQRRNIANTNYSGDPEIEMSWFLQLRFSVDFVISQVFPRKLRNIWRRVVVDAFRKLSRNSFKTYARISLEVHSKILHKFPRFFFEILPGMPSEIPRNP